MSLIEKALFEIQENELGLNNLHTQLIETNTKITERFLSFLNRL